MHKRNRPVLLPVLAVLLCAATLGSAVSVAPNTNWGDGVAFFSTMLCAPGAAVAATQEYIDDKGALPAAEYFGGDAYDSSFWTPLPAQAVVDEASQSDGSNATDSAAGAADGAANSTTGSAGSAPPTAPMPEGMVPLLSAHYEQGRGPAYIACGASTIRNCTESPASEVAAEVGQPLPFAVEKNSAAPQVLIMHTHATETYETQPLAWCDPNFSARTTDTTLNMIAVGAQIAAQLNAAGVNTVQDTTLHDYPSYTTSYAKSNATVRRYLSQYPSIKVVLDVHRDAIQHEDGTRVKPIAEIDGKTAAQIMLICGADLKGNLPNCKQNLRFAARWQEKTENMFPGLTRPMLYDYRYYNQDLTTGSLLIEVGGHANTLDEAKYAGELVGKALGALLTQP